MLLLITLMGLTACTMLQSDRSKPELGVQPDASTAGETFQPEVDSPGSGAQPDLSGTAENPDEINCTESGSHPIGQSIADTYDVSYQQVMDWFCSGYSFDNILIALETSSAVDIPTETLLQMLLEKEWEEIWGETGFSSNR